MGVKRGLTNEEKQVIVDLIAEGAAMSEQQHCSIETQGPSISTLQMCTGGARSDLMQVKGRLPIGNYETSLDH